METNIVEVENFVQQSEERRGSAFTQEVKRYLASKPTLIPSMSMSSSLT